MNHNTSLVITSIAGQDNKVLQYFSLHCKKNGVDFIVIGDSKSPQVFELEGCEFYSLGRQKKLDFKSAGLIPEKHYSRKNIGYLIAAKKGSGIIVETDDDNFALPDFWENRTAIQRCATIENGGWVNLYKYFSKDNIWPRGFALEHLKDIPPVLDKNNIGEIFCPIQQGLANENPDVDALYRLILKLPINFDINDSVSIGNHTWCPFNSQNTTWFQEAFLLLYIPSYCSFRMCDIWRSFVAERICWENNWNILFHKPTVWQARNDHDLIKDFSDEIPGYLHNKGLCEVLSNLNLKPGKEKIGENLLKCYDSLIKIGLIGKEETTLLEAWIKDMDNILETTI